MASLTAEALLGREQELRAIDGLLDGIRDRGGSMLVRGEAGLGKSALLDEAEVRAVMTLLGRASWWMPAWLGRRMPRISIEGDDYFAEEPAHATR